MNTGELRRLVEDTNDKIKGGKADEYSLEDILKKHQKKGWEGTIKDLEKQLKKGIKIEGEHTDSKETAREIAMDHLEEYSDYYDRLEDMENEAKKDNADNKKTDKKEVDK